MLNSGTVGDKLLAPELFDYADETFTSAVHGGRKEKFELVYDRTLFLYKVEAMPLKIEVSLLRVLEGRGIPIGVERPVRIEVRGIAASLEWLRLYAWPGNIRELRNILLRAAHLVTADMLSPAPLAHGREQFGIPDVRNARSIIRHRTPADRSSPR